MEILLFHLMLILSYVLFRKFGLTFNFRMKNKSNQRHINDIIELLLYGSIIYLVIFRKNKIKFDCIYFITFLISLISFSFILKIPGVGDPLPNIKKWNKNKIIVSTLFACFIWYLNKGNNILTKQNLFFMKLIFLFLIIALIISYKKNRLKTFHPHHWQIFWFLSLLIIPKDNKTKLLSSIFLSMFAHGIICYSAASIINDD